MPTMQVTAGSRLRAELQRTLIAAQGADGGWAYYPGRASRLEPTSWALLAISAASAPADHAVDRGTAFFRRLPQQQGLIVEAGLPGPNAAWNGLALLADTSLGDRPSDGWRQNLMNGLLAARGIALEGPSSVRQDNQLRAWSWTEGTFSWIEPTALCLLALKKAGASGATAITRMMDAEAVILDRACTGGGWNYGNANVLGQDLRPYVPTTALALLAMQDKRSNPVVSTGLKWLSARADTERSTMALALSSICLTVYGESADSSRRLIAPQVESGAFLGNLHLTAMALYALTAPEHGARAFRVV